MAQNRNTTTRVKDENGVYRPYDFNSNRFLDEDEYPLGSNLGMPEHQMSHTNTGRVIDRDETKPDVVDEYGLEVVNEDENKIRQFIKEAVSVDNLVSTFNVNSHETLLKLLALQDNKHPLKKGGIGIAYRTDALIMHCKMEFTAEENVVFDAILGTMSTLPHNESYRIEPSSFLKISKYGNKNTLYNAFNKGTKKLQERHLVFSELGPEGKDDIVVPWFSILRYHNGTKSEPAFIEFVPSDFFKDLALCSGLVHGAFGSLEVTTQLQGKYTIALYWYLENMKRYKEYPTATPGVFELSTDELKHQFSIPESYKKGEIERRVLRPARESINAVAECDFTFDFEARYVDGKFAGYQFQIKEKNTIDTTAREVVGIEANEVVDPLLEQVSTMLAVTGVPFTNDEMNRICNCMTRNDKDIMALMTVLPVFKSRIENTELEPIEDKTAYICSLIQGDTTPKPTKQAEKKKSNNKFNNFSQRDYDMNELEKKLIGH